MADERNHFWVGSDLRVLEPESKYPDQVSSASDIITITGDIGNHIPDNSWMLYLFEFFIDKRKRIPLELDLTCAFNNDGKFDAIFGGHNQYQFKDVTPIVGHSYVREIIAHAPSEKINYQLTDLNTGNFESFELRQDNLKGFSSNIINDIKFEGSDHFSGLEWWNKVGDMPYPIRYEVMISLLQYGLHDSSSIQKITYHPYNSLIPERDKNSKRYPVSFQHARVMKGCICYNIATGNSDAGLTYSF